MLLHSFQLGRKPIIKRFIHK